MQCNMWSVLSVTMGIDELLYDAILETNLHLSKEYTCRRIYIWWLLVEVDVMTVFIPISTLMPNCTVKLTVFIVIVICSAKFHSIKVESIGT